MPNRILAVVVTYYPEKDLLLQNILSFIDNVDKVLIWENTSLDKAEQYRFIHHNKVEYKGDGINSISHALNFAWKYAKDNSFDYLLTMDQDSQWGNTFVSYINQTVFNPNAPEGVWGPLLNGQKQEQLFEKKDTLITSGMLIPLNCLDQIRGWSEAFIIEAVDVEFCLHAWKSGVKVYRVGCACLNQRFGNPKIVTIGGHKIALRNDSPNRLYYIFRNHLIMARKYPEKKTFRHDFYSKWIKRIKWILLFEDNKIRKAMAIFKGLYAGYFFDLKHIR